MNIKKLENEIMTRTKGHDRFITGICGAPGAGKTTMAETLVERLNASYGKTAAVLVAMDGFHFDNCILQERGWLARKGAPHTFDAEGFFHTLSRIRDHNEEVYVPVFDRSIELARAGAQCVSLETPIIIVEGNYLLLAELPWSKLKPLFDLTVFLQVEIDELEARSIARWLHYKYTRQQAQEKACSNDLPNAQYVIDNSTPADIIIRQ